MPQDARSRPVLVAVAASVVVAAPALPAAASQPGSGLGDPTLGSSSTPAPPPGTIAPPPCFFGICLPWVWYQPTKVIDNNALLPIPAFGSALNNNTADPTTLQDEVSGSVTVSAQLAGKFGGDPSAEDIAGAIATLDPSVGVSATVSTDKTVEITVRLGDQGVIEFGVPAVLVKGFIHTRNVFGKVTSTPAEAWAPLYPTVFGFNAYVQPLAGKGPKSEVPVIPLRHRSRGPPSAGVGA